MSGAPAVFPFTKSGPLPVDRDPTEATSMHPIEAGRPKRAASGIVLGQAIEAFQSLLCWGSPP